MIAVPLAAEGQQAGKVWRIGYLTPSSATFGLFRQALRELGYIEGQNLVFEVRGAEGRLDRLPSLAIELVGLNVDIITAAGRPAIWAAKEATTTIPIVMAFLGDDAVKAGFVAKLGRPGGNITGVEMIADELTAKRLSLLREMLPRATRLSVLATSDNPSNDPGSPGGLGRDILVNTAQEAARALGIALDIVDVQEPGEYEHAFTAIARGEAHGVFVLPNPLFFRDAQQLSQMAVKHQLATLCEWREMAQAGCLMSYGPSLVGLQRRAAAYVDRIIRGAKPADLPVERPTTFELVINLKTAKALGLTIPPSVLLRADEVIE
jgi:putative ABC transport system substrate-binding protein